MGNQGSISEKDKIFYFVTQTSYEVPTVSFLMRTGAPSPGVKRMERGADDPLLYSPNIMEVWSYTSTPPTWLLLSIYKSDISSVRIATAVYH